MRWGGRVHTGDGGGVSESDDEPEHDAVGRRVGVGNRDEEGRRQRDDEAADEWCEVEQGAGLPVIRRREADAGSPSRPDPRGRLPEAAEDVERERRNEDGEPVEGGESLEHQAAVGSGR
jgi:hypothetical protein